LSVGPIAYLDRLHTTTPWMMSIPKHCRQDPPRPTNSYLEDTCRPPGAPQRQILVSQRDLNPRCCPTDTSCLCHHFARRTPTLLRSAVDITHRRACFAIRQTRLRLRMKYSRSATAPA